MAITFFARLGYVVVVLLAMVGLLSVATRFVDTVQYLADPALAPQLDPPGAAGGRPLAPQPGRHRDP